MGLVVPMRVLLATLIIAFTIIQALILVFVQCRSSSSSELAEVASHSYQFHRRLTQGQRNINVIAEAIQTATKQTQKAQQTLHLRPNEQNGHDKSLSPETGSISGKTKNIIDALSGKKDDIYRSLEQSDLQTKQKLIPSLLQERDKRQEIDPLTNNGTISLEALDITPGVEYLGVTVDAARHFFPLPWLKRLILYLHRLRFNLIHFRLTDDENFAIRLNSYPKLAYSLTSQLYTAEELKDVVAFARKYNITFMPEVQLPIRAGAWAAIPGLVTPCPNYVCVRGKNIPLNIEYPELKAVLKGVLQEVLEVFNWPPMFHLGGTSWFTATQCLKEAELYEGESQLLETSKRFERLLKEVLEEIGYPESNVVRTQNLDRRASKQTGALEQLLIKGSNRATTSGATVNRSFAGLDFSDNILDTALDIYEHTLAAKESSPKGIIICNWLLGPDDWLTYNIIGRLVAVALGALLRRFNRGNTANLEAFNSRYQKLCRDVLSGKSSDLCYLEGKTAMLRPNDLRKRAKLMKDQWRHEVCHRLTIEKRKRRFRASRIAREYSINNGNKIFWDAFGEKLPQFAADMLSDVQRTPQENFHGMFYVDHSADVPRSIKAGLIFDLVASDVRPSRMEYLLKKYVGPLGLFKFLQLRITDDYGFALDLEKQPSMGYSLSSVGLNTSGLSYKSLSYKTLPKASSFASVVSVASQFGIEIIPEVSISTNAGGWAYTGFVKHCPNVLCESGKGVVNDISEPQFLGVVYSVLREVLEAFSKSTYVHLGGDERVESMACYRESNRRGGLPHSAFEKKLKKLVSLLGISSKKILRWENNEHVRYSDRTGDITHYRSSSGHRFELPKVRGDEPFFVTIDILQGSLYTIYERTRALAQLGPRGIMGEVRLIEERNWELKYTGIRLIAFGMGLFPPGEYGNDTTASLLSREALSKKISGVCRAANFIDGVDCDSAILTLNDEKLDDEGQVYYDVESVEYRNRLCSSLTFESSSRMMKEKIIS